MNFEVDRYSSAWAHIALCADLTWTSEQPNDFIVTNQRLWAQNCRVNQVLQDIVAPQYTNNNTGQRLNENGSCSNKSVKDVIPESKLAQFYGNFYYDEIRENFYTCTNEKANERYCTNGCDNTDVTECWMLPEVEYWFRKLLDNPDRNLAPRRRRQYRMLVDDDFERWGPTETTEEAALEAKVRSVRNLWNEHKQCRSRAPSPPPASRKIRARRRQPRKNTVLPPPPVYCLDDVQLHCDPNRKFDAPRPPLLTDYHRAMGRLSPSIQALLRANITRCAPYRGTNVTRYAPSGPRPLRYPEKRHGVCLPGKNISPRVEQLHAKIKLKLTASKEKTKRDESKAKREELISKSETEAFTHKEKVVDDGQTPSSSSEAKEDVPNKRLYSTVLSTNAPPINLTPVIRLSHKLAPGFIKLNPKNSARLRPSIDKFDELEKEALEQYKDSDESIDTKFRELEKQAVEQYSTSNSNTSCSSGNTGEKKSHSDLKTRELDVDETQKKKNSVDSVVIYSQNFPDLKAKNKKHLNNSINLKNFHTPPRGEKKDHRLSKNLRSGKDKSKRPASDTDYKSKDIQGTHKCMRWTLPKKRHLTLCVSDFSSDEELDGTVSIKDAGPCTKTHISGKLKMNAHGGGDLHPLLRKT